VTGPNPPDDLPRRPDRRTRQTDHDACDRAYAAAVLAAAPDRRIYDERGEGTELRSVILAEHRLAARPMSTIGGTAMWWAGAEFGQAGQAGASDRAGHRGLFAWPR